MKTLDKFRLDGQVALVTGGYGNLGPYWIIPLIESGAFVVVVDLPMTKMPKVLREYEENTRFYGCDITDRRQLIETHQKIKNKIGLVTVLVNNAGVDAPPINLNKMDEMKRLNEKYKKMWSVNVQGMVNCIEEFCSDMKEKKMGSIINIGSLYAERSPHEGIYTHLNFDKPWVYGATKAAVVQLTRHFATRLAKFGIRVNTLSPGGVLGGQGKEFIKKYSERVPLGRMAEKEKDLAGPLIFLASGASSYVTGFNLEVNGGYTAW